jgi:predicted dehydrogenase
MVKKWNELGVLIVGCGSIGRRHARVLASLGVADVRACDPSPEQRRIFSEESPQVRMHESYDEGLRDRPDAVLLCTPPSLHIPQARQAILADCHVLTEKPLSDSLEGIDALESLAAEHNKKVMVALCFRFHEGLLRAKAYLDAGRIGRLVSIRALMGEHLPDIQYNGAFELMHDLDLALWFAGQKVSRHYCVHGSYSDIGIRSPDVVEMLLDFEDRCTANVHLDFFQRPRRRVLELIGTQGVISVEFARWDHCTVSRYDASCGAWHTEEMTTDRDDMFRAENREFLEAVAEDKPIRCTIAEGRKSLEIVYAAQNQNIH